MDEKFIAELEKFARLLRPRKYLSAKDVEMEFSIPRKTLLNRANLPATSKRHIPSYKLKGGRKRYFLRKDIEKCLKIAKPTIY